MRLRRPGPTGGSGRPRFRQAGRGLDEECCILCNSRLLTKGIDLIVDAIVFADPKSSVIDIVQAIGRALRQAYRQGKIAWIIIPVYLPTPAVGDDTATADPSEVRDAGEAAVKAEADAEIEASSVRTIWRVLRALAAHDARVVGRITEPVGRREPAVLACGPQPIRPARQPTSRCIRRTASGPPHRRARWPSTIAVRPAAGRR
ncbi:helicase-related protein [Kitasatospora sp. NPDC059646]|uniref:helicase-related protein n=1 Tax=Kitasatospora sp. NPDC059646 TaxID=3346893 RepID=UPI003678C72A